MHAQSILIWSSTRDVHALAVATVLNLLGEKPFIYNCHKVIGGGDLSVSYSSGTPRLDIGSWRQETHPHKSVWNRRLPSDFDLPSNAHPADTIFLQQNARLAVDAIAVLLEEAFAVNPLTSGRLTANKASQLSAAMTAGLRVPRTLISNNPIKVREFIASERSVCAKPLNVFSWATDAGEAVASTAIISDDKSLSDEEIALIPTIYQEAIEKVCEFRVTVFGHYAAATRIDISEDSRNVIDYRVDKTYLSRTSPYVVPDDIIKRLSHVLSLLGLRFGTFDLALTPAGEFVFFEVNEAGQFLWQETVCPETKVLEPFSRYLAEATDKFWFDPKECSCELSAAAIDQFMLNDPATSLLLTPVDRGVAHLFMGDERTTKVESA